MDWDRKMGEYEVHASDLVEAMRSRHQAELTGKHASFHMRALLLPVLLLTHSAVPRSLLISSYFRFFFFSALVLFPTDLCIFLFGTAI